MLNRMSCTVISHIVMNIVLNKLTCLSGLEVSLINPVALERPNLYTGLYTSLAFLSAIGLTGNFVIDRLKLLYKD